MKPIVKRALRLYEMPATYEWIWAAVARIGVGTMFMLSGWGKVHKLDSFARYFAELGIPFPELQAPFVASLELVGGLLLILGVGTRIFGFLLGCTMLVALATAFDYEGKTLSDFLYLSEWLLVLLLFWFAVRGGGKGSVDELLLARVREE